MEKGLVVVKRFARRSEAECAAGLLRSSSIPAFVFREDSGGLAPQFGIRLMVPREFLDEARTLVDAFSGPSRTDTDR